MQRVRRPVFCSPPGRAEEEEEEEEEEEFTRYEGDDEQMKLVNEMSDTWDEWEPDNPMQIMLKMAIDRQTVE